jgi:hypothetical protein
VWQSAILVKRFGKSRMKVDRPEEVRQIFPDRLVSIIYSTWDHSVLRHSCWLIAEDQAERNVVVITRLHRACSKG